jgi:hypothetical protein
MDAFPATHGSVHQCGGHNLFVGRLVLWAWVKAGVGMGELPVHHYELIHQVKTDNH